MVDVFNLKLISAKRMWSPVDVIIMMVCGLEQLEVHLPHDPDPEHPVVQELVDALLDLLGGYDGLHHDAIIRLVLGNVKLEI